MVIAREIMHAQVHSIRHDETLAAAATKMRDAHVGALPVVSADDEVQGIITDRDIVVRGLAEGNDPETTTTATLVHYPPVSVEASSDITDVLTTMEQNKVRRVMVVDNRKLVGIISEASLATGLAPGEVAGFAASIYSAPPNN